MRSVPLAREALEQGDELFRLESGYRASREPHYEEEEHLVRRFGEDYTRYMKDTGRSFPRLSPTSPPKA